MSPEIAISTGRADCENPGWQDAWQEDADQTTLASGLRPEVHSLERWIDLNA